MTEEFIITATEPWTPGDNSRVWVELDARTREICIRSSTEFVTSIELLNNTRILIAAAHSRVKVDSLVDWLSLEKNREAYEEIAKAWRGVWEHQGEQNGRWHWSAQNQAHRFKQRCNAARHNGTIQSHEDTKLDSEG